MDHLPRDFLDLLSEFAEAEVRYLVIGGYAVGFHERPRTTKDLDLLLDPDRANIERACQALTAFGAPSIIADTLTKAQLDEIVWLGNPPLRVDLLQSAPGIDFGIAYSRRILFEVEGQQVAVIGLDDLIEAKRAAGRPQDLVDAQNLERAKAR